VKSPFLHGGARLAAGLLGLALMATPLLATPPDSIKLSFDDSSYTLSIRIFHPTRNASAHYISTITVDLNKTRIISQNLNRQTSKEEQDVAYTIIDAKPGDQLTVTATCNLYGKMAQTLTVPADSSGP
jgi:desulfoferrodoxin (superoxide reductase-like protein)